MATKTHVIKMHSQVVFTLLPRCLLFKCRAKARREREKEEKHTEKFAKGERASVLLCISQLLLPFSLV